MPTLLEALSGLPPIAWLSGLPFGGPVPLGGEPGGEPTGPQLPGGGMRPGPNLDLLQPPETGGSLPDAPQPFIPQLGGFGGLGGLGPSGGVGGGQQQGGSLLDFGTGSQYIGGRPGATPTLAGQRGLDPAVLAKLGLGALGQGLGLARQAFDTGQPGQGQSLAALAPNYSLGGQGLGGQEGGPSTQGLSFFQPGQSPSMTLGAQADTLPQLLPLGQTPLTGAPEVPPYSLTGDFKSPGIPYSLFPEGGAPKIQFEAPSAPTGTAPGPSITSQALQGGQTVAGLASSALGLVQGVKSGNPGQIVSGSLGLARQALQALVQNPAIVTRLSPEVLEAARVLGSAVNAPGSAMANVSQVASAVPLVVGALQMAGLLPQSTALSQAMAALSAAVQIASVGTGAASALSAQAATGAAGAGAGLAFGAATLPLVVGSLIDMFDQPSQAWLTFPRRVAETSRATSQANYDLLTALANAGDPSAIAQAVAAWKGQVGQQVGGFGAGTGPYDLPSEPGSGLEVHGEPVPPGAYYNPSAEEAGLQAALQASLGGASPLNRILSYGQAFLPVQATIEQAMQRLSDLSAQGIGASEPLLYAPPAEYQNFLTEIQRIRDLPVPGLDTVGA